MNRSIGPPHPALSPRPAGGEERGGGSPFSPLRERGCLGGRQEI
jgi:hypothetical protein